MTSRETSTRQFSARQLRKQQAVRIAQRLSLPTLERRVLILLAVQQGDRAITSLTTEFGENRQRVRTAINQLETHGLVTVKGRRFVEVNGLDHVEQRLQDEQLEQTPEPVEQLATEQLRCEECDQVLTGRLRFCGTCLPLDPARPHELILPTDGVERVEQIALRVRLQSERYAQGLPLNPQLLTDEQRQQFAAFSDAAEDRSGIPKKGNFDADD